VHYLEAIARASEITFQPSNGLMTNESARRSFMKLLQAQELVGLFLAAVLSVPAWANNNDASSNSAVPGTVNYVEGQVYAGDQQLDQKSVRNVNLEPGQTLSNETGKAEILLTPGVFLREGENTEIKMVSVGLADTEVNLTQGHVMVEVDQIYPQNDLRIVEGSATTRIMKPGLYDFDLQQNQIRVFDGEALVREGDKQIKLKGDHELSIAANARDKTQKFDKKAMNGDDLYRWSSLRSDYVAEANVDAARIVVADGWGPYWSAGFWVRAGDGEDGTGTRGSQHIRSCLGEESTIVRLAGDSTRRAWSTGRRFTVDTFTTRLTRPTSGRGDPDRITQPAAPTRTESTPERALNVEHSTLAL
jgi:hypothetical protein